MKIFKKTLFFALILFFIMQPEESKSDIINDFTKTLTKKCGNNVSAKRLLLAIMKAKSYEDNPCETTIVINIMSKCEDKSLSCMDVTKLYDNIRMSQGTVVGK